MDKLRIGIVGMGRRACHYGGALFRDCRREGFEIVAVCDNREERLAPAKALYEETFGGEIATYLDYHEMVAQSALDGIFVAGPNDCHRDMSVAALDAGVHVLCEKPMDVTLAKCDEMMAAAERNDRILALGMQMHYRRRYQKIAEIIANGEIGEVVQLWCMEFRGPFRDDKDWVWEKARSGGAIVEKNCHHYDVLDMFVRSDPTTVYASGNIMKHFEPGGKRSEIVDNAWIVNDYANGARGMVGISFVKEGVHRREFGVQGTEGHIRFDHTDGELIHVEYNDGTRRTLDYRTPEFVRGGPEQDFLDCIRSGDQPLVTPEMGKRSLRIPIAAELSMEEKRVVHVSELQ